MLPLAQTASPRLPDLPEGPSLDRLRGPLEAPFNIDWAQVALAALVAAALAAFLVWATLRYLRFRRSRLPAPDPRQTAHARIEAAELASDDDAFARLVADAVRHYLRDGPRAYQGHKTTQELLRSGTFPAELRERAEALFATCDQTKFAGKTVDEETRIQLLNTAKEIVDAPLGGESPDNTHPHPATREAAP